LNAHNKSVIKISFTRRWFVKGGSLEASYSISSSVLFISCTSIVWSVMLAKPHFMSMVCTICIDSTRRGINAAMEQKCSRIQIFLKIERYASIMFEMFHLNLIKFDGQSVRILSHRASDVSATRAFFLCTISGS